MPILPQCVHELQKLVSALFDGFTLRILYDLFIFMRSIFIVAYSLVCLCFLCHCLTELFYSSNMNNSVSCSPTILALCFCHALCNMLIFVLDLSQLPSR